MSKARRKAEQKRKKQKTKMKKKFFLTSKKSWLIEDEFIPFYQHLVDRYCDKWKSDVKATRQVKEEPLDDNWMEHSFEFSMSSNQLKVNH